MNPYAMAESSRRSVTGATSARRAASGPPRVSAATVGRSRCNPLARRQRGTTCASGSWGRSRSRTSTGRSPSAARSRGRCWRSCSSRRARSCPRTGWSPRCGAMLRRPARSPRCAPTCRDCAAFSAPARGCRTARRATGLSLDGATVDAVEFEGLVEAARAAAAAGEHTRALADFDAALALWRGDALAEFADDEFAAAAAVRLTELRTARSWRTAPRRWSSSAGPRRRSPSSRRWCAGTRRASDPRWR